MLGRPRSGSGGAARCRRAGRATTSVPQRLVDRLAERQDRVVADRAPDEEEEHDGQDTRNFTRSHHGSGLRVARSSSRGRLMNFVAQGQSSCQRSFTVHESITVSILPRSCRNTGPSSDDAGCVTSSTSRVEHRDLVDGERGLLVRAALSHESGRRGSHRRGRRARTPSPWRSRCRVLFDVDEVCCAATRAKAPSERFGRERLDDGPPPGCSAAGAHDVVQRRARGWRRRPTSTWCRALLASRPSTGPSCSDVDDGFSS